MKADNTAIILIGFQNDYFSQDGLLNSIVAQNIDANNTLSNTLNLIDKAIELGVKIYNIPIYFSDDYCELEKPIGLLATIKEVGAFKESTKGGKIIDEFNKFGNKLIEVRGKTGFNAFNKTSLNAFLEMEKIENVVIAGVVTSVCIDSTARAAFEFGFNTIVLSDCIAGRSQSENDFYCSEIFPLYASIKTSTEFLSEID